MKYVFIVSLLLIGCGHSPPKSEGPIQIHLDMTDKNPMNKLETKGRHMLKISNTLSLTSNQKISFGGFKDASKGSLNKENTPEIASVTYYILAKRENSNVRFTLSKQTSNNKVTALGSILLINEKGETAQLNGPEKRITIRMIR